MAKRGNVGELLVSLRADMGQLKTDVQQVERTFKGGFDRIEGQAKSAGATIGRSLLAAVSVGAVIRFTQSIVSLGGRLTDLADQTRFSAQLLSGMQSSLEQAGTSVDAFAKGIFTAQRNLGQVRTATDPVALAVKSLGLNLTELQNMEPEKFADTLAKALARIENPTQRAAIGAQILGRQYQELGPAIDQLAGRFEELRAKGISEADLRLLDEFGDKWTEVSNKLKVVTAGVLSDVIRDLESISRLVRDNISQFNLFRDRAGQGALLGGLLTQPGAAGLEDVLKASLKKPPQVKTISSADEAAIKRTADAIASFTESLKKQRDALVLSSIEMQEGSRAAKELGLSLEIASFSEKFKVSPERFAGLKAAILGAADAADKSKIRMEQFASAAEMHNVDSAAWGTFAQDLGRIGLEAQAAADEVRRLREEMKAGELADMFNQDSAEWFGASEGVAAEFQRIANEITPAMQGIHDVLDSAGRGVNLTFQSIIMGTQSVSEGFQNLARNVALSMLEMTMQVFLILPVIDALKRAIGTIGSGTGVSGFIGALFEGVISREHGGLIPAFAMGGMVKPIHLAGGGIPAMVHPGEFVVRQPSVAAFGAENLAAINQHGRLPGGGLQPVINLTNNTTIGGDVIPRGTWTTGDDVKNIVRSEFEHDGPASVLLQQRLAGKGR